jgi:hypothetical protein
VSDLDLTRHQLPADEHDRIFTEEIVPQHLADLTPQPSPVVVFVGGQPGAGKTATTNIVKHALRARGEPAHICGDFYKTHHPDYEELLGADETTAGAYTRLDSRAWHEKAEQYALNHRADAVVETALADPNEFAETARRFRQAGYRVEVVMMSVPEAWSRLGILDRFERQQRELGTGRWVSADNHDRCYRGMAETAGRIDRDRLADLVMVIRRGNTPVYSNTLTGPERTWAASPSTQATLEQDRSRPWTAGETTAFRRAAATVAAARKDDSAWQHQVAAVTRLAPRSSHAVVFPASPTPGRAPSVHQPGRPRPPGPGRTGPRL